MAIIYDFKMEAKIMAVVINGGKKNEKKLAGRTGRIANPLPALGNTEGTFRTGPRI